MEYKVETTGLFDTWWSSLIESEQIDIDAVITVLKQKGPLLPFPYTRVWSNQNIATCESYGYSTKVGHTEYCTPLTRTGGDITARREQNG